MKKKTHEEFLEELRISNNINVPLEKYSGNKTKITFLCTVHNTKWKTTPERILIGRGCPICAKEKMLNKRKSNTSEFCNKLKSVNHDIKVLEEYIDSNTKIMVMCLKDGHKWKAKPNNLLSGYGCPECKKKMLREQKARNIDDLKIILSKINNNITILSDSYVNEKEKLKLMCNVDGNIWYANADHLLQGCGCPICATKSHGEVAIKTYLENNNILFESQKRYSNLIGVGGRKLSYDFYLPKYNLLIEYQGQQHEKPINFYNSMNKYNVLDAFEKQVTHDELKRNYAKSNDINLLEIWYYDFKNIDSIINNYINNMNLKEVDYGKYNSSKCL